MGNLDNQKIQEALANQSDVFPSAITQRLGRSELVVVSQVPVDVM